MTTISGLSVRNTATLLPGGASTAMPEPTAGGVGERPAVPGERDVQATLSPAPRPRRAARRATSNDGAALGGGPGPPLRPLRAPASPRPTLPTARAPPPVSGWRLAGTARTRGGAGSARTRSPRSSPSALPRASARVLRRTASLSALRQFRMTRQNLDPQGATGTEQMRAHRHGTHPQPLGDLRRRQSLHFGQVKHLPLARRQSAKQLRHDLSHLGLLHSLHRIPARSRLHLRSPGHIAREPQSAPEPPAQPDRRVAGDLIQPGREPRTSAVAV